jgi:hypothetical protein
MLPLESFFDEFEKIGGVAGALEKLIGKTVEHPGMAARRLHQLEEGSSKHRETVNALKQGYPAGWVALGMRPRD